MLAGLSIVPWRRFAGIQVECLEAAVHFKPSCDGSHVKFAFARANASPKFMTQVRLQRRDPKDGAKNGPEFRVAGRRANKSRQ